MTQNEVKWLRQVKKYPNRFQIRVDNGGIYVEDVIENEWKFDFENYGVEFIVDILNQCGYKSEEV